MASCETQARIADTSELSGNCLVNFKRAELSPSRGYTINLDREQGTALLNTDGL